MNFFKRYKTTFSRFSFFTLLLSLFMLTGCEEAVLIHSKGEVGMAQRDLIYLAVGLMLIVVIPAILLTLIFAWKYRASNTSSEYKPDWAHSNKIEFVVWTIPIIIIVILGTITWKTAHSLHPYKPLSNEKPMVIEVVSLDWKWLFIYPEQGIATVNEVAFPANKPVEFRLTSESVMNSFFIPQLGGQIYVMTGMQTKLNLIANEPGNFKGISSSYSGHGFSGMKFTAIATEDENTFNRWVDKVKSSKENLDSMDAFNKLAEKSENNPVAYFSSVKPDLFREVVLRWSGDLYSGQNQNAHGSHNTASANESHDAHQAEATAH